MIGNRAFLRNSMAATLVVCLSIAGSCGKEDETSTGSSGPSGSGGSVSADAVKDSGKLSSELSKMSSATISKDNASEAADSMASNMYEGTSFKEINEASDPTTVAADITEVIGGMTSMKAPARMARAVSRMIAGAGPRRQAASTCPVTTNTSSGTNVNVSVTGNGCKTPEGFTLGGSITIDGTADKATGNVDISIALKDFTASGPVGQGATLQAKMSGNGKLVGTGLKEGTSSFTAQDDAVIALGFSVTGTGMSVSSDCTIEIHDTASGGASKVNFTVKEGMVCTGAFGSTEVVTATGEAVQNADGTVTLNGSGEFGMSQPAAAGGAKSAGAGATAASAEFNGKVSVELKNVVFDTAKCGEDTPAKSGTIVFKGKNTATLTVKGCGSYEVALQ